MRKKRVLLAGLAGAMGALTGVAAWFIPSSRRGTPADRERRRRLNVNLRGRRGSAMIIEFRDGIICYRYRVSGVEYLAFQDVTTLMDYLPPDPAVLIETPATLKYLPGNPANSILLCEEWSGLRFQPSAQVS